MATNPVPPYDIDVVAQQLRKELDYHRQTVGGTLSAPADGPMFRTAPDGAVLDRAGNELQPASKKA